MRANGREIALVSADWPGERLGEGEWPGDRPGELEWPKLLPGAWLWPHGWSWRPGPGDEKARSEPGG